uniref:Uncharacterized protein n=1 Tax=Erpetoichthys calabaricus TaxID=27687 RepID=A0A8C4SUY8_ERPCA
IIRLLCLGELGFFQLSCTSLRANSELKAITVCLSFSTLSPPVSPPNTAGLGGTVTPRLSERHLKFLVQNDVNLVQAQNMWPNEAGARLQCSQDVEPGNILDNFKRDRCAR